MFTSNFGNQTLSWSSVNPHMANMAAPRSGLLSTLSSASLERVDRSPDRGAAMFAMCGFTELHDSVWFPKLDVNIVAFQMMLRLLKPERVHQRDFGLCGPAHFV